MLWDILWRKKNTISLTFCLSFSILCLVWQGNVFSRSAGFIGGLSDRLSGALNSGLQFTGTLWVQLDQYRELEKRYAAAQKLLEEYRLEKDKFDVLKRENESLRKQLDFAVSPDFPEIKAEVLGMRLSSISPRIIIGRGIKDGVSAHMPVITRCYDNKQNLIRAVVGIVIAADTNTSIVQPLTHASFRLGVQMPETGQWAILSGNSGSITQALLTYISSDAAADKATISHTEFKLKLQQTVYTSGAGGIFPRGIPVGILVREGRRDGEFKTAYVKPFASFDSLDYVTVILKKPENWSINKGSQENWDEHLITPFGEPVYPEDKLHKNKQKKEKDKEKEKEKDKEKEKEKEKEKSQDKMQADKKSEKKNFPKDKSDKPADPKGIGPRTIKNVPNPR